MQQDIKHARSIHDFLLEKTSFIYAASRRAVGRSGDEARDVAHDAIANLLVFHRRGTFDPSSIRNEEAYLLIAVRNAAARAMRGRRMKAAGDDVEELVDRDVGRENDHDDARIGGEIDARRRMARLERRLRPRDKEALRLLVEDGLEIETVATTMGTTRNHVYQMRHRIREAARALPEERAA